MSQSNAPGGTPNNVGARVSHVQGSTPGDATRAPYSTPKVIIYGGVVRLTESATKTNMMTDMGVGLNKT